MHNRENDSPDLSDKELRGKGHPKAGIATIYMPLRPLDGPSPDDICKELRQQ